MSRNAKYLRNPATGGFVTVNDMGQLVNESGSAVVTYLEATRTLTNAEIKALPTTGIDILVAQGAGTIIRPNEAVLHHFCTADYTNINANCQIRLSIGQIELINPLRQDVSNGVTDGLLAPGNEPVTAFSGQQTVGKTDGPLIVPAGAGNNYDSDVVNQALTLQANNSGDGNFTGGHANNRLFVTVSYRLITLV